MADEKEAAADCLSRDALQHFKIYKYSSVDKSPISNYVLKHYWNACVQFLPYWLAPNTVTLIGFLFILFNVALMSYYDPDFIGPKETWVYYSYAFGIWAYSTMDNIDGKQARRTGTSSGLGELFDHGIDSLNCTLASILETSSMGLGATKLGAFTMVISTLPMFASTWETYHTHTLYLGYFNGPTEGLIIASSLCLVSGYYGPQMWRQPIARLVGFENVLGERSMIDIWVPFLLLAFFVVHLPTCVYNVYSVRKAKGLSFTPTLLGWIPMIAFCGWLYGWLASPYSNLLRDNHLCLLCLTLAFVFGRMTTKIILAHLTRQAFPHFTTLLLPLAGGVVLVNLPRLGIAPVSASMECYYLWAYFLLSVVVYFRWAYLVIDAICNYLGIPCFTVPEKKWQTLQNEQRMAKARKSFGSANGKKLQ